MSEVFANNAISTLASSVTSSGTTISLAPGSGVFFPAITSGQFFRVTLTSATIVTSNGMPVTEIAFCTARSVDSLTISRGQEGTTPISFNAGDIVANEITAGMMVNTYNPGSDQDNVVRYAVDTGVANAYAIALNPSMPTSQLGDFVMFKAAHTNTGASTLTINGGTSYSLVSKSGNPFTGGEIQASGMVGAVFNGVKYVIAYSTNEATENFNNITTGGLVATGTTTVLNVSSGDTSTKAANTNFVANAVSTLAPKDSPTFTGIPTAPTDSPQPSDQLATLKTIFNSCLGFDQKWRNVTTSRSGGVAYPNNTGRPIQVVITWHNGTGYSYASFNVGCTQGAGNITGGIDVITELPYDQDPSTATFSASVIVPNGQSYGIHANSGANIDSWAELS